MNDVNVLQGQVFGLRMSAEILRKTMQESMRRGIECSEIEDGGYEAYNEILLTANKIEQVMLEKIRCGKT